MENNKKIKVPSKDGQYYDTVFEASAANRAWDEQIGLQKK